MSDQQVEAAPEPVTAKKTVEQPAKGTDWWAEAKGVFWLVLAVLGFHSFIAKPFYIPSESMMPSLIKGDRLVVTKYPYGWSYVSPSFHVLPFLHGRLFGRLPARGDIVILKPPTSNSDYIKRVIGLPGDRIAVRNGTVILNGTPVRREFLPPALVPVDANAPCNEDQFPGRRMTAADGKLYCQLPIVRETLPGGVRFDTVDLEYNPAVDEFGEITVPPGRVFVMGDNRDRSADSRVPEEGMGLGGPVPFENIGGRAEFITFSLDGSSQIWNPLSWFTALRGGRALTSLHPEHIRK